MVHVRDVHRHSLFILVRVKPRNERGLAVTAIGEGHAIVRDDGGGVQLQARSVIDRGDLGANIVPQGVPD